MSQEVVINGQTYQTYATVEQADEYENGQFGAVADAWRAQTDDDAKARALVTSYGDLNRLSFTDGYESDPLWQDAIVTASIEYAAALNEGSFSQALTVGTGAQKRVRAGSAEVEYFEYFGVKSGPKLALPPRVYDILRPWLQSPGTAAMAGGFVSGVDCPSAFRHGYGVRYP